MADRTSKASRGLDRALIPDLARPVALHGSMRHAEVTGSACMGIVITMAIYAQN